MVKVDGSKSTLKVSVFLHDEKVKTFKGCIKDKYLPTSKIHNVKKEIGMTGKIYIHDPEKNDPDWKSELAKLTKSTISVEKNVSNKAVVVFKCKGRFMSLVYGYGRSMLKDSTIVRNFGLIVAANLVDSSKIKSLNSMSIEDIIVDTQKQSSGYANQEQLQVNKVQELLKSISGMPNSETIAKFIVGTDSLKVTRKMDIVEIKESLEFYFDTYKKTDYRKNGFEWLDNIKLLKDSSIKGKLEEKLAKAILRNDTSVIITPNKIIDWSNIKAFFITGMGSKAKKEASIEIDQKGYIKMIQKKGMAPKNIVEKLKRDQMCFIEDSGAQDSISSIYDSVIFETSYKSNKYILCYGSWYEINSTFYDLIVENIKQIPQSSFVLQNCKSKEKEGTYNKRIARNKNFVLLDQKNYQPAEYGRSKVEPCDIFTRNKQLIHVKKGQSSSALSHLFSQAAVSARILAADVGMKNHINELVKNKFGANFISKNEMSSNFEVIFAIITEKKDRVEQVLPFFSMVNLYQTIENLKSMEFNYSIMIITQL